MKHLLLLLKFSIVGFLLFSCTNDEITEQKMKDETQNKTNFVEFIDEGTAMEIASQFILNNNLLPENATRSTSLNLKPIHIYLDSATITSGNFRSSSSDGYAAYYYVLNIGNEKGFIIVSGDGATMPVLGYSTESTFNPDDIPTNMAEVLASYRNEINYRRKNNITPDASTLSLRSAYINGEAKTRATATSVAPLLGTIKWNQSPYYNAYCPPRTPVGCVATATSQIMRYWEYPARGKGTYAYNSTYGRLSFDYNYDLRWDRMPKPRLTAPNDDIAKLCYGVAVGIKMNFSPSGSGAWQEDVPRLLKEHYNYPNTMQNIYRNKYTADQWATILRRELDAKRPIQYAGYGTGGGHSFVCDGYSANGYFHFNWGWGGMSDGYFLLHALNPGSLGTGGGAGGFNSGQSALIGIQSPDGNGGNDDEEDTPDTSYCESKGLYARATFIKGVSIGNMTNSTQSNGGYAFFSSKKIEAKAGSALGYQLIPGFYSQAYPEYWRVWIDYNNNGNFDSNELVIQRASYYAISGSIKLPYPLSKGTYRVRVAMKWGSYSTPCETFEHGEVEDYTLVIN